MYQDIPIRIKAFITRVQLPCTHCQTFILTPIFFAIESRFQACSCGAETIIKIPNPTDQDLIDLYRHTQNARCFRESCQATRLILDDIMFHIKGRCFNPAHPEVQAVVGLKSLQPRTNPPPAPAAATTMPAAPAAAAAPPPAATAPMPPPKTSEPAAKRPPAATAPPPTATAPMPPPETSEPAAKRPRHECPCGNRYAYAASLDNHRKGKKCNLSILEAQEQQNPIGLPTTKCPVCAVEFRGKQTFENHWMRAHHNRNGPYNYCPYCNRLVLETIQLRSHFLMCDGYLKH